MFLLKGSAPSEKEIAEPIFSTKLVVLWVHGSKRCSNIKEER